jgi:glycosyltransferase involved in cell wall biosynthesis
MVRRCALDRAGARAALGLPQDKHLLLCIGFIQSHKGFERAIEAVRQTPDPRLMLRIVGSVRLAWDVAHAYAQRLHDLADQDPRCQVIEGYLSDELFDTWIVAADTIVIPYHEIWTSGVAARAKLYGRPLLAANTGGLAEQLTEGSRLFSSDAELAALIHEIAEHFEVAAS